MPPHPTILVSLSNIVTAFNSETIGTKVTWPDAFWKHAIPRIEGHDFESDPIPGQGKISFPEGIPYVSGGMGKSVNDPNAYVLRSHRGKVHAYLKRKYAEPVQSLDLIVYTMRSYLNDPDINECPGEADRIWSEDPTHVLVAILASGASTSVLSPYRFVKNLAGGNKEALAWTADQIRSVASGIASQVDMWSTVSD